MPWNTLVAIISAAAAVLSVGIGWGMYRLASKEQGLAFERWIAANEPWLRVSFEHDTDEDMKGCFMSGYPAFIRIRNEGKIPCRIDSAKFGGESMRGRLRKSTVSDTSIGGTLDGARIAPGETLYFRLSRTEKFVSRAISGGHRIGLRTKKIVPLEIAYSYEPERKRLLTVDVKLVASKKWTMMRVVDSSVVCTAVS